jgi:predicted lipid-binding transport protein (Tim44 family)
MLGGLLMGGLIGSLLFGGLGMRRRQAEPAGAPGYGSGYSVAGWPADQRSTPAATLEAPPEPGELDRGLGHIRQMDAGFDPAGFAESATDMFFKIQAAWTSRDIGKAVDLLTQEMRGLLQEQCDRLRAERRINRLENIAVRQAAVTEAWQEKGQDYATVYFLASLLDYTTDESGAQVLEGSRAEPVKFEEYWTFTRPVGPNPWRLSAIQQST